MASRLRRVATEVAAPEEVDTNNRDNRWTNHYATLRVELCSNTGGRFAQVEVLPASSWGRSIRLCFPSGKDKKGRLKMAKQLELFSTVPESPPEVGKMTKKDW